ncbi:purine and uridine phosphorylase [Penicillium herquei]|nr:purine and uridine phosphorylase [Penicillium herquei]
MEHHTYLWLHLAMDDIRSTFEDSFRPVEESIQMIPISVNEAYKKILSRVPLRQKDTIRKALQLIVAARRPLATAEMAIALGLAIRPDSQTISEASLDPSQIGDKLRQLCGLFIFINNSKVYLIHQTAREFLITNTILDSVDSVYSWTLSEAGQQMGSVCVRYLVMEDSQKDGESIMVSNLHGFLEYSAIHWPHHIRKMAMDSSPEIVNLIHCLYDTNAESFWLWFPIFWTAVDLSDLLADLLDDEELPSMDAIHIASFNGHECEVDYLLGLDNTSVNLADSTSTYPIIWASLNGHSEVIQKLLDKGADINIQGGEIGTALWAACSKGHDKTVQILLEKGADVNILGPGIYRSALHVACSEGHERVVHMLLDKGADINQSRLLPETALWVACSEGHDNIVQILLERGADVNQSSFFGSPLREACSKGHEKIVQILLEKGADPNHETS